MKKTFEVIKTVLTWLIVLLAVCMMVLSMFGSPMIDPTYQKRARTITRQGTPVGMMRLSENERGRAELSVFSMIVDFNGCG
mgnify:CR=1 FL=1